MSRSLARCVLLYALLCWRGAVAWAGEAPAPGPASAGSPTWVAAMAKALEATETAHVDDLIDHQLSPAFIAKLKEQHGEEWRTVIRKRLERLSYFYHWLEEEGKRTVEDKGGHLVVRGEYGCFAEFDKVGSVYLIGNFGQVVTSM